MRSLTPWTDCHRAPRGWYCTRSAHHDGPCAAKPCWWNIPALIRYHR